MCFDFLMVLEKGFHQFSTTLVIILWPALGLAAMEYRSVMESGQRCQTSSQTRSGISQELRISVRADFGHKQSRSLCFQVQLVTCGFFFLKENYR